MTTPLFRSREVVGTPAALEALHLSGESAGFYLTRHFSLDQGDLNGRDHRANAKALVDGGRILSAYTTARGTKIWLITEAVGDDGVRASTCLLLPEEY